MKINKIYNENCFDTMSKMPDNFIDLTVTSPPYDNLRDYKGYSFDFESIANELFRVTKKGGVVVWVVGDATINGSETGTSFKQALYFKEIGFNLHDTMFYQKNAASNPSSNRYEQTIEYMFILSKGKPKKVNLIKDKINRWAGSKNFGIPSNRKKDGTLKTKKQKVVNKYGSRSVVWKYNTGKNYSSCDDISFSHPAIFPEQLAADHIYTWSNENDLIYDPFGGSGTTAKMAHIYKRNWILSEISKEYCDLAEKRLYQYINQKTLF
jgi:site-specific DNA-methyltransferase (adenine-specific)